MTAFNKQALREAAEKATPGRVGDRIDGSGSIKYECHGYDGSLVLRTDHKNMEYGFIGDNGDADELFFRLCVPDVILALLDELEAAEKRIAEPASVPDERAAFETFMEKRFKDCIDRRLVKNGDGEYFAWDMQVAWIVWQERAAMLHAGNSPVTPDCWVACSERMPDVGDVVLTAKDGFVNVGEMERSGANYRYFTSIASGRELPATHWQPLPAAPQQEDL